MDLLASVAVTTLWPLGYLLIGTVAGRLLWTRSLVRFGRDTTSLNPWERSALLRECLFAGLGWLPLALVLAGRWAGNRLDEQHVWIFANRSYPHLSTELPPPPWQCALAKGRHRDDVADLERNYTRMEAMTADCWPLPDGGQLRAESHTAHCPGCRIVLFRTALVRYDPASQGPGTVLCTSRWTPTEHDLVWSVATSRSGRRKLAELLAGPVVEHDHAEAAGAPSSAQA